MALFPPGKGGGEGVAYGYKGKGILIHTLTDGNGLPLSNSTTAANGSEQKQVIPLLNSVLVKTNSPGRPRKRVKVLAADKGYDSKDLRGTLRKRGIRPQLPRASQENKKKSRQTDKNISPTFSNRTLRALGFNGNIVGSLFDGREFLPVSMLLFLWQQFTFGLTESC
jgi:transposase